MHPFTYQSLNDVPHVQVAIILGASVVHNKPSPILASRADTALALYHAGTVEKILVTGDNGELSHDEVTAVRKYLTDAGIPDADIFLDHAGFDTYSSMYRARDVFEVTSAIIVTQDFHLPRALYIARHLGLTAYGIVSDGGESSWYNYLREIPASDKALYDLWTARVPKYLGTHFPLDLSVATSTWY
jgi:SanA protein